MSVPFKLSVDLPGGMSGFISRATFAYDTSCRAEISVEAENITKTNIRFVFDRFLIF